MERQSLKQIEAELIQLLEQQLQSLEAEIYVGISASELREFDIRQERIHELTGELEESVPHHRSFDLAA